MVKEIKHQLPEIKIPSEITRKYQNIRLISSQAVLKAYKCGGCLHGIRKDTLSINETGDDIESGTKFYFAEQNTEKKVMQLVIQVRHDEYQNKDIVSVIAFHEGNSHDIIPDI